MYLAAGHSILAAILIIEGRDLRSENFYDQVFPVLSLMPVWALLVICWILHKGQLCPGQRSRIQGELITLWTVLFVGLMMGFESLVPGWVMVLGAIGGGYGLLLSIWQSKLPGKRSIPDKAIFGALVPLGLFALGVLVSYGSVMPVLMMMVAGTAFCHLIIVKARHRLEAFNLLLPTFGVVIAILCLFIVAIIAALSDPQEVTSQLISDLLWYIGFLVAAIFLWLTPLVSKRENSHTLLGVATFLLFISQVLAIDVMSQLFHLFT